jgi:hypothetical protein
VRERGADAADIAHDVHIPGVLPDRVIGILERADAGGAHVVDDDVEPAERLHRAGDCAGAAVRRPEVCRDAGEAEAGGRLLRLTGGDHDARSFGRE